jgi:transcriptional regulator with XRE-family HTH domain
MPKVKRAQLAADAHRRNLEQLARLAGEVRAARLRRRMTQRQVADLAGISRSAESAIERGLGCGQTLDTWQRVALAAGRPLVVGLERDRLEEVTDAGHLAIQELVLRLGRRAGFGGSFELATRPAEPWRSSDVGLRDDRRRILALIECWNTIGDFGSAARSSERKRAEAAMLAIAKGGDRPYLVTTCWVVRSTKRNRALAGRYPEVFAARFPGSSIGWVRALTADSERPASGAGREPPPREPGLVWCDVGTTRLFAWRRR